MQSMLKYWYGEKSYYLKKNFIIWQRLVNLENAIVDSHIPYPDLSNISLEMAQFIVDSVRIGDWWNDYDKFYHSLVSHTDSSRDKLDRANLLINLEQKETRPNITIVS